MGKGALREYTLADQSPSRIGQRGQQGGGGGCWGGGREGVCSQAA